MGIWAEGGLVTIRLSFFDSDSDELSELTGGCSSGVVMVMTEVSGGAVSGGC